MTTRKIVGRVRLTATGDVVDVIRWLDDGCVGYANNGTVKIAQNWEYEVIERR